MAEAGHFILAWSCIKVDDVCPKIMYTHHAFGSWRWNFQDTVGIESLCWLLLSLYLCFGQLLLVRVLFPIFSSRIEIGSVSMSAIYSDDLAEICTRRSTCQRQSTPIRCPKRAWVLLGFKPEAWDKNMIIERAWLSFQAFSLDLQ